MDSYTDETRVEARHLGRTYALVTKPADDGFLDLTVTSDAGPGPLTELTGRLPSDHLEVIARLMAGSTEIRRDSLEKTWFDWDYDGHPQVRPIYPEWSYRPRRSYAPQPDWATVLEEKRKTHPNAYKPWATEDDSRLRQRHAEGATGPELESEFGRAPTAVNGRLAKLGLTSVRWPSE